MCDPYSESAAAEVFEHDGIVLWDLDAQELALELMAVVVQHLGAEVGGVAVEQAEFYDELAAVAYAEGEGVGSCVEVVEGFTSFLVVEEGAGPAFSGAEDVGVGETAAEDNHVDILERLTAGDEVGHVDILNVEAGEVEGVGHFAVAIDALLTDDSRFDTGLWVRQAKAETL